MKTSAPTCRDLLYFESDIQLNLGWRFYCVVALESSQADGVCAVVMEIAVMSHLTSVWDSVKVKEQSLALTHHCS